MGISKIPEYRSHWLDGNEEGTGDRISDGWASHK